METETTVHGNSLVRRCGNPGNIDSSPFTHKTETALVLKWVTTNTFILQIMFSLSGHQAATTEINHCIFCCVSTPICPPKCFKCSATLSFMYIPILYIKMY